MISMQIYFSIIQPNNIPTFTARKRSITKQEMETCIAQNKTNKEIADECGVTVSTVCRARHKYDLLPGRRPFPKTEIIRLVEEGKTDKQISEITGLSYQYTSRLRRNLNLKPQSPSPSKSTIEGLFQAGYKHNQVAKMLDITSDWLVVLKKKYGIPLSRHAVNVERITELIKLDYPDKKISEITGTGIRSIGDIRRGLGKKLPFRNKCKSPEVFAKEINEVKSLFSKGKSTKEIAEILGRSLGWVYKRLRH